MIFPISHILSVNEKMREDGGIDIFQLSVGPQINCDNVESMETSDKKILLCNCSQVEF